jgi:hypothetical protein
MISWLRRRRKPDDESTTAAVPPAAPAAPVAAMLSPQFVAEPVELPHDKVAARAYEIWVRKGRPDGLDAQNWLEAEAELRAEFAAPPEAPPRKSR